MLKAGLAVLLLSLLRTGAWSQLPKPHPEADGTYYQQGGIVPPKPARAAPANYPADPQLAKVKHICVVSAIIGIDGTPTSVQLENTHQSPFDASAIEAVKQSTFSPGTLHDSAIPVLSQIWVEFRGDRKPGIPAIEHGKFNKNPSPVVWPNAEYTDAARRERLQGSLLVSLLVTEDGRPTDLHILQHMEDGLDEQALKAVSKAQFNPAMLGGQRVPDRVAIGISFASY